MSLISSIFGEASSSADKLGGKNAAPDLFGLRDSIPSVLPSKSVAKVEKLDDKSNNKKGENPSEGDNDDASVSSSANEKTDVGDGVTARQKEEKRLDEEKRTIFVGNLPPDISRKALASIFKECGGVSTTRLRSLAVAGVKLPPEQAGNQNLMKKVCVNTGKLLGDAPKKSAQGYVVFESEESLEKALKLNNTIYKSHTIRVDHATPTIESARSVFVGNLPYAADEESLREHFLKGFGEGDRHTLNDDEGEAVKGVRIIREKDTQKCKGFGYVILRDASLVQQALQMHGTTYMKRELRVLVSGKRFKGKRGDNSDKDKNKKLQRRPFEGKRAIASAGGVSEKKPSLGKRKPEGEGNGNGEKAKRRRARSETKSSKGPATKSGLSRRAATEQKVKKRVKKLTQRAARGMGKGKK